MPGTVLGAGNIVMTKTKFLLTFQNREVVREIDHIFVCLFIAYQVGCSKFFEEIIAE